MDKKQISIIMIGGSAGSMPVLSGILNHLPLNFGIPVVLIVHRMKNVKSEMHRILVDEKWGKHIIEPDDKCSISQGNIYLAPQNYHLLIEENKTFSLDYSEEVNFSRPSIDVSFESAAKVFGTATLGILLSGSNKDGATGLQCIVDSGGVAIVQSPETAEYKAMPQAAIDMNKELLVLSPDDILNYLLHLVN